MQQSLVLAIAPTGAQSEVQVVCNGPCVDGIFERLDTPDKIPRLVELSSHLFYGMVVRAEIVAGCDHYADVTFRVSRRWKGIEAALITVRTGGPCEQPFPFAIGREYLVAATEARGDENPLILDLRQFTPLEGTRAGPLMLALVEWHRGGAQTGQPK